MKAGAAFFELHNAKEPASDRMSSSFFSAGFEKWRGSFTAGDRHTCPRVV